MLKADRSCTLCKLNKEAETVCLLGSGSRRAEVMVIGEAPGQREDEQGVPFVGKSGQYLESVLEQYGFERKDIFLSNAVSCRPPDNRTPSKSEIKACKVWLDRQLRYVKPKFVLLLGNVPLLSITGEGGIKKRRGKAFEKDGIIYMPTYHPSYILRQGLGSKEEFHFQKDVKAFQEIVECGEIPREKGLDFVIVDNTTKFKQLLRDLDGVVSIDCEATNLYPWGEPVYEKNDDDEQVFKKLAPSHIVSIGFGTKHKQYILPVQADAWKCPFPRDVIETMLEEIESHLKECIVVGHNGKFDFLWLWVHFGLKWYQYFSFDTMLAHYILDENDFHALDHLAKKFFGAPDYDVELSLKQGKSGTLLKHAEYLALDLFYTRNLRKPLLKLLRDDGEVKRIFDKILMPCARLFTEIEYDGVYVDESKMDEAEKYLRGVKDEAERAMLKAARKAGAEPPDNWGSPDQVARFLFGKKKDGGLGIPIIEKTKTGKASTSESVIKRIEHPIGGDIIKFRGAKQQLSFFIDGWKPYLIKHRIHPSFKLHGTVTGRLSCEHPNLQQVPRDVRIRELIIAPPGWTLLEADLSQIELRIAAELAQEPSMLDAFRRGIDVHWLTATGELARGGGGKHAATIIKTAEAYLKREGRPKKLRFGEAMEIVREKISPSVAEELQKGWGEKDPEMLWKEIRKKAKAVNFGFCVRKGTKVSIPGDVVSIEKLKPGDLVYCYDDNRDLTLRPVIAQNYTGKKVCYRVYWQGGRGNSGHLDVTGDHQVRLVNGSYKRVGQLKRGDRVLAVHRTRRDRNLIRVTGHKYSQLEYRVIFKALHGYLPEHVHHKDENPLNDSSDNLIGMTAGDHHKLHGKPYKYKFSKRRIEKTIKQFGIMKAAEQLKCGYGSLRRQIDRVNNHWIVKVKKLGVRPTYDIEVKDHPNFIANELCVHNCYGMWWKKFKIYARDNYGVILTDEQSQESREAFFAMFPALVKWHERQKRYARLNGYVRSLSGRKRRLPEAMSGIDSPQRAEAERQSVNSPVQSFANELNLMSALQLRKEFGRDVARIVGTVHDSMLVWVKNEHVASVATRLLEIMTHPELMDVFEIEIGVPVMGEAKLGPWGAGVDYHKWMKQHEGERKFVHSRRREQSHSERRGGTRRWKDRILRRETSARRDRAASA